jgi:hypothetical protein
VKSEGRSARQRRYQRTPKYPSGRQRPCDAGHHSSGTSESRSTRQRRRPAREAASVTGARSTARSRARAGPRPEPTATRLRAPTSDAGDTTAPCCRGWSLRRVPNGRRDGGWSTMTVARSPARRTHGHGPGAQRGLHPRALGAHAPRTNVRTIRRRFAERLHQAAGHGRPQRAGTESDSASEPMSPCCAM